MTVQVKKIIFRVDASLELGIGHLMRCCCLADYLTNKGCKCEFILKDQEGNSSELLESRGYKLHRIKSINPDKIKLGGINANYRSVIDVNQEIDAIQCRPILELSKPQWLIVDHYSLGSIWENKLKHLANNLMVVDDLADRNHVCDVLLDQTYSREITDYSNLTQSKTEFLLGSNYSLLRQEFRQWRKRSLAKRNNNLVKNILISLGGVDNGNITCDILQNLNQIKNINDVNFKIILGSSSPHKAEVLEHITSSKLKFELISDANNMAELYTWADIVIGGGGSSAWERCCLGVPTILLVLADNQKFVAECLQKLKAVWLANNIDAIREFICLALEGTTDSKLMMNKMSEIASSIVDGYGVERVGRKILA
jgi:UDP-2,4-diacetamido-2,4,6-trideoxy-beta-L-altropyranose hydrolase